MAMPASGCIALRCCITGCACSSIGIAVCGTVQTPTSLTTMSTSVGWSSPHCMREFYGFSYDFDVGVSVYNCEYPTGCMGGTALLMCFGGGMKCFCSISTNMAGANWTWYTISECVCVDMSGVSLYDATCSYQVTTSYYWSDYFSSGSDADTDYFQADNYVDFCLYYGS